MTRLHRSVLAMLAAALLPWGALAQDAESPFADAVEARHGLMRLLADNLGKLGSITKGETPYDAAVAGKAAANVAALATVLSPDLFSAGSEYQKAPHSDALPAIWANPDDFLARIAALNTAAAAMQTAAGIDLAAL